MKVTIVGMYEAKANLSKLVRKAAAGEEIVVSNGGTPVAKIVAYSPSPTPRKPGLLAGKLTILPGFDDLPAGFEDAFGPTAR